MHKATLKLIELRIIGIYLRERRQIEIANVLKSYDTEVIDSMPFGREHPISEGIKALSLPTELVNSNSCFRRFIEEHLQFSKLFLFGEPHEITQTLYLLFELG